MVEHVLNDSLLGLDVDRNWQQPPENTLESLRHGILHSDGIELDLRKTCRWTTYCPPRCKTLPLSSGKKKKQKIC